MRNSTDYNSKWFAFQLILDSNDLSLNWFEIHMIWSWIDSTSINLKFRRFHVHWFDLTSTGLKFNCFEFRLISDLNDVSWVWNDLRFKWLKLNGFQLQLIWNSTDFRFSWFETEGIWVSIGLRFSWFEPRGFQFHLLWHSLDLRCNWFEIQLTWDKWCASQLIATWIDLTLKTKLFCETFKNGA